MEGIVNRDGFRTMGIMFRGRQEPARRIGQRIVWPLVDNGGELGLPLQPLWSMSW
jgi:hypothetical protein